MTPTPPPGFELLPAQRPGTTPPPPPGFELVQPPSVGELATEAERGLGGVTDEVIDAVQGAAPNKMAPLR